MKTWQILALPSEANFTSTPSFNARAAAKAARAHAHTSPQQQEQPPVDVPYRSKKKAILPGASLLFFSVLPYPFISLSEPHSRRALNVPVVLPDIPQGMINPNHPNHYIWVEMCNQLHTPITGSSNGLN
jgi:hypothetical protein